MFTPRLKLPPTNITLVLSTNTVNLPHVTPHVLPTFAEEFTAERAGYFEGRILGF